MDDPNKSLNCFLCLKATKNIEGSSSPTNPTTDNPKLTPAFANFLIFAEQHLQLAIKQVLLPEKNVVCCQDCESFVERICQLYDQLCKVQHNLGKRLSQLSELLGNSNDNPTVSGDSGSQKWEKTRRLLAQKCKLYSRTSTLSGNNKGLEEADDNDVSKNAENSLEGSLEVKMETDSVNDEESDMEDEDNGESISSNGSVYEESDNESSSEDTSKKDKPSVSKKQSTLRKNTTLFPLSCDLCGNRYKSEGAVYVHMRIKHRDNLKLKLENDKPFSCEVCGAHCKTKISLMAHHRRRHGILIKPRRKKEKPSDPADLKPKCPECSLTFDTRRLLAHHIYEAHKQHKKTVNFMNGLEIAKKSSGNDAHENCVVCGALFKSWDVLRKHLREHEKTNSDKKLKCYFCSDLFSYEQTVWAHLKSSQKHDLTKIEFSCDHADHLGYSQWSYPNPSELEQHFCRDHEKCPVFKCSECQWPFLDKNMLDLHRLVHLPRVNYKHQCPTCHLTFMKVDRLQSHYNTEHGVSLKLHKCSECPWGFATKTGYTLHMKVHEQGKDLPDNFLCSECPKTFQNAVQLKNHKRNIHAERQCKECGLVLQSSKMSFHMRTVHCKVPHLCPDCGKVFRTADRLKGHMSVHGKGKVYACQFCDNRSKSGHHLRRHMRRMHKDQVIA